MQISRKFLLLKSKADCNVLHRSQASLKPFVVEVIDHHPYPTQCTNLDIQKNIELVGSCSTLVAEKMLLDIPTDEVPDEVLMLLLSEFSE